MKKILSLIVLMMLCVTGVNAQNTKTIGLVPGPWAADNATFAVYAFNSDTENAWFPFVEASGAYGTQIPDSWAKIILVRLKPATAEGFSAENYGLNWDNKWNQTADIDFTAVADQTVFTITGWGENDYTAVNPLDAAKAALQKVVTLAKMFGYDTTQAEALLASDEATVEQINATLQALVADAKEKASEALSQAKAFFAEFDATAAANLASFFEAAETALAGSNIDTMIAAAQALTDKAMEEGQSAMAKVDSYLRKMENTTVNTDLDNIQAALLTNDIQNVIAAVQQLKTDIAGAAQTYLVEVSTLINEGKAAGKDVSGMQTALTNIMVVYSQYENGNATLVNLGEALYQLIKAVEDYKSTFTATFMNDADPAWEAVYAYTWTGDGESKVEQLGAWPGTQLTANEAGLFVVNGKNATLPAFIIFHNNAGTQTADLAFEEGKEYCYWGIHEFAYKKYLVKNIASGMFWAQANSWGTQASLVPNAEYVNLVPVAGEGKYNLESQVNNGGEQYYFNGDFMDSNQKAVLTITKVADGKYTIANGDNYYGWDGTSTVLGKNLDATSENVLWTIVSLDDAKAAMANATVKESVDATFLIEDHNFGRNNRYDNKWEGTGLHKGGDNANLNTESYMAFFDVYQTLSEVPNGIYELKAQAAVTYHDNRVIKEYDGQGAPVIYANEEASDFNEMMAGDKLQSQAKMSAQFSAGEYQVEPVFVQVTDGTLKIGAKCERADIWAVWDNFTLTYYGADASIDQVKNAAILAEMQELKAKAEELAKEMEVSAIKEALEAAVAQAAAAEGADAINVAIEALKAAIEPAEAINIAKNVLPRMKQLVESTNVYTEEAYNEYYGQWFQKYEAGTLTKAEASALQDPFVVTGWHASITCDNFLLSAWDTNPDFQDAPYYINTWSVEGENDGSNFKVPFFEYWTGDDYSLGERTLTATMNGLAAGWYDVTAWVRVRAKNGYTAPAYGIKMQANDGDMTNVCAGEQVGTSQFYLANFTAKGEVGEDGVLKIKFIVAADNNVSWLSFQNVNYAAAEPVEYTYTLVGAYGTNEGGIEDPIFTTTWDPTLEANDLVLGSDGIYTKTYENIELEAGTILYKVVRSHSWDINWGFADKDGGNADYVVNEAGKYNITFTFNPVATLENGYNLSCTVEDATSTGISTVATEAVKNGNVYNLNGQRVVKAQKGLYIINGRKQVVK